MHVYLSSILLQAYSWRKVMQMHESISYISRIDRTSLLFTSTKCEYLMLVSVSLWCNKCFTASISWSFKLKETRVNQERLYLIKTTLLHDKN
jgi:hypothetical protein